MSDENSPTNATSDVFSWGRFSNILDDKLKDVAKKDDLQSLQLEIAGLKKENIELKNVVSQLSSRLEYIDRKARATNIVVSGLRSINAAAAKNDFLSLCETELRVNVNIVLVRPLQSKKSYLFTLESSLQTINVLAAKKNLMSDQVYIQKDYTKEELNIRYNLRKINKTIAHTRTNLKTRLGDTCIYIENRRYSWSMGKVVAYSRKDADYLISLFAEAKLEYDVFFKHGITGVVDDVAQ